MCVAALDCPSGTTANPSTSLCETCPSNAPYTDTATNECVDLSGCTSASPYGDDVQYKCVMASDCDASIPYGNPVSGICVAAADCSDGYYGDDVFFYSTLFSYE